MRTIPNSLGVAGRSGLLHRFPFSRTALLLALVFNGCGREARKREPFLVFDSAGVEITVSSSPLLVGGAGWRIDADPLLQIGAVQGDEAYQFTWIEDAVRAPDGKVLVLDLQSREVRVFGADGGHLTTFGGSGEGPGEFGRPAMLALAPPDTLLVWDPAVLRVSRFSLDGGLLGEVSFLTPVTERMLPVGSGRRLWHLSTDGALLSSGPMLSGAETQELQGDRRTTRIRVVLLGPGSARVHDFGVFPYANLVQYRYTGLSVSLASPFSPHTRAALGTGLVVIGMTGPWEVRAFRTSGGLLRIVRAAIPRVPATRDALERAKKDHLNRQARSRFPPQEVIEAVYPQFEVPDSIPAIGDLEFDAAGNLWVGRRALTDRDVSDWDVFTPEGRWLTSLSIPPELGRILEFGEDHILAAWEDEWNVQYLRLYRIHKDA